MIEIIKTKPFIGLVITLILGTCIGLILSFTLLASDNKGGSNSVGTILMLATGGAETGSRGYTRSGIQSWEEILPVTLSQARNLRWEKDVKCVPNVGYYSRRAALNDFAEPYSLIIDNKDKVIGIYLFSENQQQPPWEQMQATGPFPYPHWGLHIFFQDSANACG